MLKFHGIEKISYWVIFTRFINRKLHGDHSFLRIKVYKHVLLFQQMYYGATKHHFTQKPISKDCRNILTTRSKLPDSRILALDRTLTRYYVLRYKMVGFDTLFYWLQILRLTVIPSKYSFESPHFESSCNLTWQWRPLMDCLFLGGQLCFYSL